ncbi:hypothetical protein [Geomonas anaerohicana]|uniref:Lipoprotein n=1 Tax=Geomonas anaerohicana TaxID=2798583 RepID=A0ABS0YBW8_9BACT|nr:hypothetical protein [Geomonas anaerohicana]MBJ6749624.1 hypothetical protein [Geomonas anaerohicana]
MKKLKGLLLLSVGLLALTSCGGGESDPGASVALFKTVKLHTETTPDQIVVQIASGNTCTNNVISGTVNPGVTDPTVTVLSSIYNSTITGQNVSLNSYTVTFSPIAGAPAIPGNLALGLQGWFGGIVPPGNSASRDIPVTTAALTDFFATNSSIASCTPTQYKYYATINIAGTEESGTDGTIRAVVPVTFTNIQ